MRHAVCLAVLIASPLPALAASAAPLLNEESLRALFDGPSLTIELNDFKERPLLDTLASAVAKPADEARAVVAYCPVPLDRPRLKRLPLIDCGDGRQRTRRGRCAGMPPRK